MRKLATIVLACSMFTCIACERYSNYAAYQEATRITGGGDPHAGIDAIRHYGCQGCHEIPGITGARGVVGPPLTHMANRIYVAGQLPNTPENLMHWIQRPHDILPHTAMPNMGVTEKDSRDIAAYLYTLK
ncbi:MAG: c-type cytochrome [Acidobacteriaceae bacterium]